MKMTGRMGDITVLNEHQPNLEGRFLLNKQGGLETDGFDRALHRNTLSSLYQRRYEISGGSNESIRAIHIIESIKNGQYEEETQPSQTELDAQGLIRKQYAARLIAIGGFDPDARHVRAFRACMPVLNALRVLRRESPEEQDPNRNEDERDEAAMTIYSTASALVLLSCVDLRGTGMKFNPRNAATYLIYFLAGPKLEEFASKGEIEGLTGTETIGILRKLLYVTDPELGNNLPDREVLSHARICVSAYSAGSGSSSQ